MLIEATNMTRFPPRLAWQPIFYPVLNQEYASEIAVKWNLDDEVSGYAGFVTAFEISSKYFEKFEVKNVGGFHHNELWIPSECLEEFNDEIVGSIKVIQAHYGSKYQGERKY